MQTTLEQEMMGVEEEAEMAENVPAMTDSELVTVCMQEASRGIGGTVATDNDSDISLPLDYYFGRVPGMAGSKAKDPSASRFVSMDVMDGIEATVAEIMPTFTADLVAFYEPDNEEDEDAAQMETELVNYLLMEEYDGFTLLQVALKDALLHRNCTVKAYWDERAYVEYETHEDIPEMALQSVLAPTKPDQSVEVVEQVVTEMGDPSQMAQIQQIAQVRPDVAQQVMQTPQGQQGAQEAMMAAQDKYTIKIKRTTIGGKPKLEAVPPEEVIVAGDHDSPYLHNVRFIAHEKIETQSSLIEQGFDPEIVDELSEYNQNIEDLSRSRTAEEDDYGSAHRSTRLIRVYECYPLIDFDGDGIAERRKVVIADNKLLSNEEWKDIPLIGGVVMVVPHRYKGISMYDRLKDIQDSKTPVVRSIVDGTQLSSNPRIGVVTGEVNLDDLLTSRTGGVVRMDSAGSVVTMPNPEVPQSSYGMLEYMDGIRNDRGGSAINTANQAQKVQGDTAHGIERTMSAMELGNAVMARSMGETLIRGIFIQLHNLLREHHQGDLSAQVGGRWIKSSPSDWNTRSNVSVQIGSSYAERARQGNVLNNIIAIQKELMDRGSVMTDEGKIYTAITDAAKLQGLKNPEQYFVDIESEEGKQKKQQKDQQNQQQKQQEEQMRMIMFQSQKKLAEAEMMKGQADMMAQKVELQTKIQKQESDNQIAMLNMQLEREKQQNQDYKDGVRLAVETRQQEVDTAIKLTELEATTAVDQSEAFEDNLEELGEDE